MTITASLFDTPMSSPLASGADWLSGTLLGSVAIGLCVIAVAFVGLLMMTGRLAVRDALRVLLGCFVLLGAPVIAEGLHGLTGNAAVSGPPMEPVRQVSEPAAPLPPADYDPYAGASLRVD